MLTGIITQDNMVILSDDGYPIIESEKPSVPEYCKAEPRTAVDPSPRHVRPMRYSWSVTEGVDNELVCQGVGRHHAQ